jgi:hypothetical protein
VKCSCCNKQKAGLKPRKSQLLPGVNLLMCGECLEKKYEPKWVIILSARRYGKDSVSKYINDRRYCGDLILAEEVIV